jgi:hypothetical protein
MQRRHWVLRSKVWFVFAEQAKGRTHNFAGVAVTPGFQPLLNEGA